MNKLDYDGWSIKSNASMRQDKKYYESIFSQGNGYMGIRGSLPEDFENQSYERCTYIAGVFDYIKEEITDMVNVPDYMNTKITVGEEVFEPLHESVDIEQTLWLRDGILERCYCWKTKNSGKIVIKSQRFLSIDDIHTALIRYEIVALEKPCDMLFETGISANVSNQSIEDDQLKQNHTILKMAMPIEAWQDEADVLKVKTTGRAGIHIIEGSLVQTEERELLPEHVKEKEYVGTKYAFRAKQGKSYCFDKLISVFTSRECKLDQLNQVILAHIKKNKTLGYNTMYRKNKLAWMKKWETSDIEIEGDIKIQTAIRYNIFQLIQTNAEGDCTVNIGARGIMHGRYKGCYFWDTDIFMLPFYVNSNQEAARNLVMYRYLKLDDARKNAKELNLQGARYPWMCSIDGREQCESWDIGKSEIHVTADVAYAVDYYVRMSNDLEFYENYAIEIYAETARYHVSRLTYDENKDMYNLMFVKGPDEYCGITSNNTYTNWMIRYNMKLAVEGLTYLKENRATKYHELTCRLGIKGLEIKKWDTIRDKISLPYDDAKYLYIQDDTFMKLEPLMIDDYKTNESPLYHSICFDRLQRYRVLKQADLVLLVTLFPDDFSVEQKQAIWNYYEPLTLHDSSLSYGVHANLAANLSMNQQALAYFEKSVLLDLEDIMSSTGKEGLHFAAFGASWQALIMGFAGIRIKEDTITVNPNLPMNWSKLRFHFKYKGSDYQIEIKEGTGHIQKDGKIHNKMEESD
ncbi:MAG: glycoside hydrolase family 65 protein [Velocimicrobium sp.]